MTNKELRKKYLIGTKVKYVLDPRYATPSAKKDIGKIGTIVGYSSNNLPIIFLPVSEHISYCSTATMKASWSCWWRSLEILPQKNKQLEFSFMQQS